MSRSSIPRKAHHGKCHQMLLCSLGRLIFGKDDQLFPKSAAMPFINQLDNPEVHEVQLGHWLVVPALDEYLVNLPE